MQAHVVIGRIQFLQVVGLSSLFSCWLSAGGHSQCLESPFNSLPCSPLSDLLTHGCLPPQGQQRLSSSL